MHVFCSQRAQHLGSNPTCDRTLKPLYRDGLVAPPAASSILALRADTSQAALPKRGQAGGLVRPPAGGETAL